MLNESSYLLWAYLLRYEKIMHLAKPKMQTRISISESNLSYFSAVDIKLYVGDVDQSAIQHILHVSLSGFYCRDLFSTGIFLHQ